MNIQLKDVDNVVFNGIDISAVKFNDVLVWRKWETIEYTGAVPVTVTANGEPLLDYLIKGNMFQQINLCDNVPYKKNYYINEYGVETQFTDFNIYKTAATANTTYTLSTDIALSGTQVRVHAYANDTWIEQMVATPVRDLPVTFTTPSNTDEIRFSITNSASGHIMLNHVLSPASPIQPQECGERTGNLYNNAETVFIDGYLNDSGVYTASSTSHYTSNYTKVNPNTTYTLSAQLVYLSAYGRVYFFDENKQWISRAAPSGNTFTFTTPSNCRYIQIQQPNNYNLSDCMLVSGSTPPSTYEPYGYKLDISSGGENLFDYTKCVVGGITSTGEIGTNQLIYVSDYIEVEANTNYTGTHITYNYYGRAGAYYDSDKNFISALSNATSGADGNSSKTFSTPANCKYMRVSTYIGVTDHRQEIMLNLGSTAKPYTPYNRTTTPIYLGEVETVRHIGVKVFDGTEAVTKNNNSSTNYLYYCTRTTLANAMVRPPAIVSHLPVLSIAPQTQIGANTDNGYNVMYFNFGADIMNAQTSGNTVDGVKEYLAAQYAAGTPFTVWYVLETPVTGIVNEPIRKIGDYADSISMEQAQVQIPTVSGANVVDINTTLKPSEVYIKYKGKST